MNQENQLQSVIELIEKTGDKAIVLEKGKPAYVMMRLKDYEGLILGKAGVRGLTEEELLDKINREIAIWKSSQEKIKELEGDYDLPLKKSRFSSNFRPNFDWEEDEDELEGLGSEWDFDEEGEDDDLAPGLEMPPFEPEEEEFDAKAELDRIFRDDRFRDDRFKEREDDRYYVEPVE